MEIMELIDEVIRQRVDAEIDFHTYYSGYEKDRLILQSRITAMQEVCDIAVKFEEDSVIKTVPGHCVECDLIIAVKKYKAIKE